MALYNGHNHLDLINAIMAENDFEYPLTPENTEITKLTIKSNDPSLATATIEGIFDSGMRGFTTVKYHRVDIATLVKNTSLLLKVVRIDSTKVSDMLPFIRDQLGLDLKPADIVEGEMTLKSNINDRPIFSGVLEIRNNNPILYGSFEFLVDGILLDISRIVSIRDVDGIVDTSYHHASYTLCTTITYDNDYSAAYEELMGLPKIPSGGMVISPSVAIDLAAKLSLIDGLPWFYEAHKHGLFNLSGATLMRNCSTGEYDLDPKCNKKYDRVLMLKPGSYSTPTTPYRNWGYMFHYDELRGKE